MSAQYSDPTGRGEDFDALADLFLGEPERAPAPLRLASDDDETSGGAETNEMVREVLLLGHLPVRANPWVAQYARLCAERAGAPVALVRMSGGQMGVDVYGLDPDFRECQAESSAEDALDRVAGVASRVVFQISDTDELTLATGALADRVTVLTAANDAAVVSVYRTAKRLSGSIEELGVAVMGDSEARARAAVSKLAEAGRAFLNLEIVERGIIDKMGPTGGAMVYLGACELTLGEIAERVAVRRERAERDVETKEPVRVVERKPAISPMPAGVVRLPHENEPARNTAVDAGAARLGRHQASRVERDRSVAPAGAPMTDAPSVAMSVLELKPIGAACPDDEGVSIARDDEGAVHLLVADEERRGIERLTSVRAWAGKHAKLLRAIDSLIDAEGPFVLHLLTERPKDVRHLLECDVRVHVLTRADARIGTGWVFLELN